MGFIRERLLTRMAKGFVSPSRTSILKRPSEYYGGGKASTSQRLMGEERGYAMPLAICMLCAMEYPKAR